MSDYVDDLVRQWELADPRDRWRHTREDPPSEKIRNSDISRAKPQINDGRVPEEVDPTVQRMLVCDVCGAEASSGYGLAIDGIRMGDAGSWRCAEHHPDRLPSYSMEQWASARSDGKLYPDSTITAEAAE